MHHPQPHTRPSALRDPRRAGALLVAVLLGGCTIPEPPDGTRTGAEEDTAAVADALDARYAAFSEAYARANVQMLMDQVYAPDAFYLPPGSPILEGQDQFRGQFSFLERFARAGAPGPDISFDIVDRDIAGDLAYDIGVYTIRSPDAPDGQAGQGKFIVIWKRTGGEWRIHADAYSPVD